MQQRPLLIDTDPGVDDALALLMALAEPSVEVLGLTIAAGNVGLAHTQRNALALLEACQRELPVFPGCPGPLVHASIDAAFVHGEDGFGDAGLAEPQRRAETEHAALAMLRFSHQHAQRLELVMLGPLTNLALALRLDPSLPQRVHRLVVMGGAVNARGNISAAAEFNIGFDPEAAHIVFSAWPQLELVDWEATLAHPLAFSQFDQWMDAGGAVGAFYRRISQKTRAWVAARSTHWHSADGLAMAVALDPAGVELSCQRPLRIETEGRLYRGATHVDWLQQSGQPAQTCIVQRYNAERFAARVAAALAGRAL